MLTLGDCSNQSLEVITLPGGLQTFAFGAFCDQSLQGVTLPSSLQTVTFGHKFSWSWKVSSAQRPARDLGPSWPQGILSAVRSDIRCRLTWTHAVARSLQTLTWRRLQDEIPRFHSAVLRHGINSPCDLEAINPAAEARRRGAWQHVQPLGNMFGKCLQCITLTATCSHDSANF